MHNKDQTETGLLQEMEALRQQVAQLEQRLSDSKQREEALVATEEKYKTLFDHAPVAVYVAQDDKVKFLNPETEKLLGYTREEITSEVFTKFIHPEDQELILDRHRRRLQGETLPSIYSFRIVNKSGVVKWVELKVVPFIWENRPATLCFQTDITEHRKLEMQLRHAQKMEALGTLAGGIAHEFNNLLVPILGHTEMLTSRRSEHAADLKNLNQIRAAGERAKELVQQMLAYGRKSLSKKTPVDLEMLVDDTIKLLKNTIPANISIQKEIDENLLPIMGTLNDIHQALLNICINAWHAMPEGGNLTIGLKNAGFHRFINTDGLESEGNFVKLSVQDTGIGMEAIILERIYDPFFTTKEVGKGTGLGLSVVQGIVEQHGGRIEVETQVNRGTRFDIFLPALQEEQVFSFENNESVIRGNERLLLIDDESMVMEVTESMLSELGYDVLSFLDCEEALKWFAKHASDCDLVLTDYGMPKMNGKQFAEQLKVIQPDIPIILLTGYGDLVAKENIQSWGMNDILVKPFNLKELGETVRGAFDHKKDASS